MSSRYSSHDVIVLRRFPASEQDIRVEFLSADRGLIYAHVYGARKKTSRMGAAVSTFARGRCLLYGKSTHHSQKIVDLTIDDYADALHSLPSAYALASVWTEIICKSHAGSDHTQKIFSLFDKAIHRLPDLFSHDLLMAHVVFLWHYLHYAGLRPSFGQKKESHREDFSKNTTLSLTEPLTEFFKKCSQVSFSEMRKNAHSPLLVKQAYRVLHPLILSMLDAPLRTLRVAGNLLSFIH